MVFKFRISKWDIIPNNNTYVIKMLAIDNFFFQQYKNPPWQLAQIITLDLLLINKLYTYDIKNTVQTYKGSFEQVKSPIKFKKVSHARRFIYDVLEPLVMANKLSGQEVKK